MVVSHWPWTWAGPRWLVYGQMKKRDQRWRSWIYFKMDRRDLTSCYTGLCLTLAGLKEHWQKQSSPGWPVSPWWPLIQCWWSENKQPDYRSLEHFVSELLSLERATILCRGFYFSIVITSVRISAGTPVAMRMVHSCCSRPHWYMDFWQLAVAPGEFTGDTMTRTSWN